MVWVAGADGCKRGWIRASRETETGELRFDRLDRAADLLAAPPRPTIVGLDMPIGLPESGPRDCDRRARACLGRPRASSVFPAPIRPALAAATREDASRITQARDGRGVGAQAWNLYAKVREVDALLQSDRTARRRLREVHPEVSFWAWSGRPMAAGKKTRAGKAARQRLVASWLGPDAFALARDDMVKAHVADDDILDAIAALWTAHRIAAGNAGTLPEHPPVDATGLRMEIVY